MYNYDAIGSYERSGYFCQGSGKELIQPVLDNQLKAASPLLLPAQVGAGLGGHPAMGHSFATPPRLATLRSTTPAESKHI